MEKQVVSVKEFQKIMGIGRGTAYNLVHSGVVKSLKLGKRILIPASEIDRLCNA